MEENNNVNEFNLKQDWDWERLIWQSDDRIHSQEYDIAFNSMLEYLEIESADELTQEHLDECERLIEYLESPSDKGGLGLDLNGQSQASYAYYRVMQDWIENFDLDHTGAPLS